jgi:hypothetical protein
MPKALAIEIKSVHRTRKTVCIHYQQGDSKFELEERDNPLPAFGHAFDALVPLVATILHLPAAWAEQNLRVVGITMGEQGGAQTVVLACRKGLDDASKEFKFATPARLLAHPGEPGKYTPPLTNADAGLVQEAIEQAKLYVKGERAQGQIAFADENEEDDGSGTHEPEAGEELPFAPPSVAPIEAVTSEPKRERKRAKATKGTKRRGSSRAAAR